MFKIFPKYNDSSVSFSEREKDRLPAYVTDVSIPEFDSIPVENWVAGNDSIREMINRVHPTFDTEDAREEVIQFMKTLLQNALDVKVFEYGSVPLKTYLPQGDIDLAVLGKSNNYVLFQKVICVLETEKEIEKEAFQIRDIRFIDAKVKVVKCTVNGITVDLTINQLGGLCSLCFLEHIDRLVAKNHLFKHSIMVIKAWCYYESHILGSSHGLISTYGLEILILFIFHMYNASLTDPLKVLYRFLEYYSKFDWSNFGVSMDGPVSKESLPLINVDNPIERSLLGGEDLRNVINVFMVPKKKSDRNNAHNFRTKFINVVDPLKDGNNLGRSVYVTSDFMRIKSAFRYAARRLGEIMNEPRENVREGIKTFFKNTFKLNSSNYIHEVNPLFRSFSSSPASEVNYEAVLPNFYTDEYNVWERNGVSNAESVEESDVSAFDSLSVEPDNEQDFVADGLSDFGNAEDICRLEDYETFTSFADLTGYQDTNIRSLLFALEFLGLTITTGLINASKGGGEPSKPEGLNPNAPPFLIDESSTAHRAGSFDPVTDTVTKGKGQRPKTPTRLMQRTRKVYRELGCVGGGANNNRLHGGSSAPKRVGSSNVGASLAANINIRIPCNRSGASNPLSSQEIETGTRSRVNTQRKLIFGSYCPDPEIHHSDAPDSVTYFEPERKAGRVRDQPFELKNEEEFPALSV